MKATEKILKQATEENIKFINLWFVDILGQLKSVTIRDRELEKDLGDGYFRWNELTKQLEEVKSADDPGRSGR